MIKKDAITVDTCILDNFNVDMWQNDIMFSKQPQIAQVTYSIFPYLVRMRKIADQKNSEYGHFSRSAAVFLLPSIIFWQASVTE